MLKRELNPAEILFVADAMIGQDAVRSAGEFHKRLGITGVILTKMDGDARGGAALSIRKVTGAPVKFVGVGEKYDALEPFYPDRIVSPHPRHGRRARPDRERRENHRREKSPRTRAQAPRRRFHPRGFPRPAPADPQDGLARTVDGHAAEDRPLCQVAQGRCSRREAA